MFILDFDFLRNDVNVLHDVWACLDMPGLMPPCYRCSHGTRTPDLWQVYT